jgi:leucyl aminopeptidase
MMAVAWQQESDTMQFPVKTDAPGKQKTACAVVPVFKGGSQTPAFTAIDRVSRGSLKTLIKNGDASADLGQCLLVPNLPGSGPARALLVGCGARRDFTPKCYRQALTAAAKALKTARLRDAICYLTSSPPDALDAYYTARHAVETTLGVYYEFTELKSKAQSNRPLTKLGLACADRSALKELRRGVNDGIAIAAGTSLARDLGNRPPNVCTPTHLAAQARALAKEHAKLRVEVLDEAAIKRLKMGAFLSVTQGAVEPPRLIVLHYRGGNANEAPVAICGKGITFDTGGISLKPPAKMDEMKFDMCGAAGVIGTIAAVAALQLPINVLAVVPACENMPSGTATRPGDIVTTMSGQTVEILNTDAEGRLILCDAMTYALKNKPRYLIDVATLTGACVIAIGNVYTGLFSNDDDLAGSLLAAGQRALDPAWRLPADEEYGESLKSNFADFANSGGREGGASVAANYLSRFVDSTPWAHLDIAGVAWKASAEKGATGRVVPLLTDFLLNL